MKWWGFRRGATQSNVLSCRQLQSPSQGCFQRRNADFAITLPGMTGPY